MSATLEDFRSRLVISGENEAGRSTVVSDSAATVRVVLPVVGINDLWQCDTVPAGAQSTLGEAPLLEPPRGGVVVRTLAFPPDSAWKDDAAAFQASADAVSASHNVRADDNAGFHKTPTIDVLTVISGELHAVLEEGEVRLGQGDSFVQVGTNHAWSNRTDETVTAVVTMISASL